MPDCSTSTVNLRGSINVGGDLLLERERGRGDGGGDSPRERDREVGEGDGETWDIGMSGTLTCTVATDKNTDRAIPRQKMVGNLRRGGWLDGNVGQVLDRALFFCQKETCWSGDKQRRSKQDAK